MSGSPVNFPSTYSNHIPPFLLKGHYRNCTESLTNVKTDNIHCSPLVYRISYHKRQSVTHGSHLANPSQMLLTTSLSFTHLAMASRRIFSTVFLKTKVRQASLYLSRCTLLVLLYTEHTVCSFPAIMKLPQSLWSLQNVREVSQWHQSTTSAPLETSHLLPRICEHPVCWSAPCLLLYIMLQFSLRQNVTKFKWKIKTMI